MWLTVTHGTPCWYDLQTPSCSIRRRQRHRRFGATPLRRAISEMLGVFIQRRLRLPSVRSVRSTRLIDGDLRQKCRPPYDREGAVGAGAVYRLCPRFWEKENEARELNLRQSSRGRGSKSIPRKTQANSFYIYQQLRTFFCGLSKFYVKKLLRYDISCVKLTYR